MPKTTRDIPLHVAHHVIDVMNAAADIDGSGTEKARHLLRASQAILGRRTYSSLVLLENLTRRPAPVVAERVTYSASPEYGPVFDDEFLQEGVDLSSPVFKAIVPHLLERPRDPIVTVCVEDAEDRAWVEEVFRPRLQEAGYEDALVASWSTSPKRAIIVPVLRPRGDRPFSTEDRETMSLMIRAIAPFIDREIFTSSSPLDEFDLTERQRDVLFGLLAGESEKEIASNLQRSVHTVHTFVKQLYEKFSVSSRGELMARFIDNSVAREARRRQSTNAT